MMTPKFWASIAILDIVMATTMFLLTKENGWGFAIGASVCWLSAEMQRISETKK